MQFFASFFVGFCTFLRVALAIFYSFGGFVGFFVAEGWKKGSEKIRVGFSA